MPVRRSRKRPYLRERFLSLRLLHSTDALAGEVLKLLEISVGCRPAGGADDHHRRLPPAAAGSTSALQEAAQRLLPLAVVEIVGREEEGVAQRLAAVREAEVLARLAGRFERGSPDRDGSGLGLTIVTAIAERLGSRLEFRSPRPGHASGLEASVNLSASETAGHDACG